jgi:hypothetical protein
MGLTDEFRFAPEQMNRELAKSGVQTDGPARFSSQPALHDLQPVERQVAEARFGPVQFPNPAGGEMASKCMRSIRSGGVLGKVLRQAVARAKAPLRIQSGAEYVGSWLAAGPRELEAVLAPAQGLARLLPGDELA